MPQDVELRDFGETWLLRLLQCLIIRLAMWVFLYGAELSSVLVREQQGDAGVPVVEVV